MSPKSDRLRLAATALVACIQASATDQRPTLINDSCRFITKTLQFMELVAALDVPVEARKTPRSHGKRATTAGFREDINLTVRSRWEANVARYLNWLQAKGEIKKWLYEPQRWFFPEIKSGVTSYLPDFWIENPDDTTYWLEVKGWWDARSKTAVKRFRKYYPEEELKIIDGVAYKKLEKELKDVILNWELSK